MLARRRLPSPPYWHKVSFYALHSGCWSQVQEGYANHVFAELFEDCLKRGLEAQAFSGREIGSDDGVLNFLVGHFVDVDLTRQAAP
jgi:hypothetical protein